MANDVHPNHTRHANDFIDLHISLLKYQTSHKSVKYSRVITWNALPVDIKMSPSIASFKRKYKMHLMKES